MRHRLSVSPRILFIVTPVTASRFASLFSAYPPLEERIARLEAMAKSA